MSNNGAYKRCVTWLFTVNSEEYALSGIDAVGAFLEETRKNGQEDCHFSAEVIPENCKWRLDAEGRDELAREWGDDHWREIERYLNENGLPQG